MASRPVFLWAGDNYRRALTTRRRRPIGMQTFREIREQNCYSVDQTAFIGRLLDEGKHYFLSRPRRFRTSTGSRHPGRQQSLFRMTA